jgi:hypothetical protein
MGAFGTAALVWPRRTRWAGVRRNARLFGPALHHDLPPSVCRGVDAPWLFEGAMTILAFETDIPCELIPTLRRGDIVLLDNLSAHKSAEAQSLVCILWLRLIVNQLGICSGQSS